MKVIILAAGQGSRLRPLTDHCPKCMVKYQDKPLIEYQLETCRELGITNISIVTGYLEHLINYQGLQKIYNEKFMSTNMVHSFFCAESIMNDDLIISYGDILYDKSILQKLIEGNGEIRVVVDKDWRRYWQKRMPNPLDDAETMKINQDGNILELGKKAKDYDEIEGQYIGLIYISKKILNEVVKYYHCLDRKLLYEGKDFANMYMTTFLQLMIDSGRFQVKPIFIKGNWMEIDCEMDLECNNL